MPFWKTARLSLKANKPAARPTNWDGSFRLNWSQRGRPLRFLVHWLPHLGLLDLIPSQGFYRIKVGSLVGGQNTEYDANGC